MWSRGYRRGTMQRLGWAARRYGRRHLAHTSRRLSSSTTGSEHDDFWTAAQTEAKTTPAYEQAARASSDTPSPSVEGDRWAVPGGFGPGRMPMGEAYGPSTTSGGGNLSGSPPFTPSTNTSNPRESYYQDPVFDMLDSMHLSLVKQVDVRTFKGATLVDIRQYYKGADGSQLPTKKGIALTIPQWRRLQAAMGDIDNKIESKLREAEQFGAEGPGGGAT